MSDWHALTPCDLVCKEHLGKISPGLAFNWRVYFSTGDAKSDHVSAQRVSPVQMFQPTYSYLHRLVGWLMVHWFGSFPPFVCPTGLSRGKVRGEKCLVLGMHIVFGCLGVITSSHLIRPPADESFLYVFTTAFNPIHPQHFSDWLLSCTRVAKPLQISPFTTPQGFTRGKI